MLAQHGWKSNPSPRRGFTVVEASRALSSTPIVVAVHDSAQGLRLFRAALDEAMNRAFDLVVLDYGDIPLRDVLRNSATVDERERSALRALWTNPHVRVVRTEPVESGLEPTITFCEKVRASMLIVGAEHLGTPPLDADLASRVFNGEFDVLVVTDHSNTDSLEREPPPR